MLEWRERARLYKSLLDQRTQWVQRIHAELFHHGVPVPDADIRNDKTRAWLTDPGLGVSPAGRQRITVAYRMITAIEAEQLPLRRDLTRFGVRQPACRALAENHYGVGGLIAVMIWSELGDCQRFSRSRQVVRHAGLDVTVDQSDIRRAGGKLTRQGPQTLRWALYEAAKASSRRTAPDNAYYAKVKAAHNGKVAALSIARSLARRCYHTLRSLDPDLVYAMP